MGFTVVDEKRPILSFRSGMSVGGTCGSIVAPAPGEPTGEEWETLQTHTCHINLGAAPSASERVGEKNRHEARSQSPTKHTIHPMRLLLHEGRGRRANDHSFGSHRYSVQTDGWHPS